MFAMHATEPGLAKRARVAGLADTGHKGLMPVPMQHGMRAESRHRVGVLCHSNARRSYRQTMRARFIKCLLANVAPKLLGSQVIRHN